MAVSSILPIPDRKTYREITTSIKGKFEKGINELADHAKLLDIVQISPGLQQSESEK